MPLLFANSAPFTPPTRHAAAVYVCRHRCSALLVVYVRHAAAARACCYAAATQFARQKYAQNAKEIYTRYKTYVACTILSPAVAMPRPFRDAIADARSAHIASFHEKSYPDGAYAQSAQTKMAVAARVNAHARCARPIFFSPSIDHLAQERCAAAANVHAAFTCRAPIWERWCSA